MASSPSRAGDNKSAEEDEVACDACGFEASFVPEGMIQCVRCRTANYCSVTCLQWHWKSGGHSRTCVPVAVEDDDDDEDGTNTNDRGAEDSKSSIQTEPSLVSMDVNNLFDSATAHTALTKASSSSAVSVEESMSSATTAPASNQLLVGAPPGGGGTPASGQNQKPSPFMGLQRVNAAWEEKAKGVPPSSTLDPAKENRKGGGGGLNLGTFFENQKKQPPPPPDSSKRQAEAASGQNKVALVTPASMAQDDQEEEEEVIIEEYEEEEEVMSLDLLNEDSGHDNLKSIVEESEVTGDDPDFEGSWRSREPFAKGGAWASPHSSPSVSSSSSNHKASPLQQQLKLQQRALQDGRIMRAVIEDAFEETTEVEEVVEEESTSFMEEEVTEGDDSRGNESKRMNGLAAVGSPGQARTTAHESSSTVTSSNSSWKQSPSRGSGSAGGSLASPRSAMPTHYSSRPLHRAMDDAAADDRDSSASNSVDALMNQYGYDSAMDDDDSRGECSSGSLNAETGGDTTRTDDTSRLAAQPALVTSVAPRLIDDDTGTAEEDEEDDCHDMLFGSSGHPPSYLRQQQALSEIDSLYSSISKDPDSSMGTITTEERSSSVVAASSVPPTGQDSREATSTGASAGQQSKEEGSENGPLNTQLVPPKSTTNSVAARAREAAPSLLRSFSDSSQMSIAAAESVPEPKPLPSTTSMLERRHSGPSKNAASSLLDFRNVYGGGNRSSSAAKGANSLKDFRLAYVAAAAAPETPSSITSTMTSQSHSNLGALSPPPEASASRSEPRRATEDPEPTDALPAAPTTEAASCKPLTASINQALVDYERVFGKEAAAMAFMQLTQGAGLSSENDRVESHVHLPPTKMLFREELAPAVASEPLVVAVMSHGEDAPSDLSSSAGRVRNGGRASSRNGPSSPSSGDGPQPSPPRYLTYRNVLSRSVGSPPRASEIKPRTDTGADTMDESSSGRETERDEDNAVSSVAPSTPASQDRLLSDSPLQEDTQMSPTPSPGRRYESYRSNLSRSLLSPLRNARNDETSDNVEQVSNVGTAVAASANDDIRNSNDEEFSSGSSPFDELGTSASNANLEATQMSALDVASSASREQPRYLSYRQSIARRVPQGPAPKSTDADVDDANVQERLSSYLKKGMVGMGVAGTGALAASTTDSSESHAVRSVEPSTAIERNAPEPLKSRRAANALARAKEAQGLHIGGSCSDEKSALSVSQTASQPRDLTVMRPTSFREETKSAPSHRVSEPFPARDLEEGLDNGNDADGQNEPDRVAPSHMKRVPKRVIIVMIIVAIIAIVVGATVGVLSTARAGAANSPTNSTEAPNKDGNDGTTAAPNESTIDPPSQQPPASSPTGTPATDPQLLNLLTEASDDQGESLQQVGTPQNQAYTWLAGNSELDSYGDEQKLQRYALATLYYGTGGEMWSSSDKWLSDDSECSWFSMSERPCDDSGAISRLALASNNLQGAVPPEIGLLSTLTAISLSENGLTSVLPSSLGGLSSLTRFMAYDNELTGSLITEMGALSNLEELDLHGNRLTGEIPPEIGQLIGLETLDLSGNRLGGTIPSAMGLLANMVDLRLQSNQLEGPVPQQFGNLTRLVDIRIEDNNLTGTVPTEVCDTFSETMTTFYLDCGGSEPEVSCPPGTCCTYCCSTNEAADGTTCQCLYEGTGFDFLCG